MKRSIRKLNVSVLYLLRVISIVEVSTSLLVIMKLQPANELLDGVDGAKSYNNEVVMLKQLRQTVTNLTRVSSWVCCPRKLHRASLLTTTPREKSEKSLI